MKNETEVFNGLAPDSRTWFQRLIDRMFPSEWCELPEAPASFEDVLHVSAGTRFSLIERLRVLATGRVEMRARIVCEKAPGATIANSVFYVKGRE